MEYVIGALVVIIIAVYVAKKIKKNDPDGLGSKIDDIEDVIEEKIDSAIDEVKEKLK
jgi:hypothetical protein